MQGHLRPGLVAALLVAALALCLGAALAQAPVLIEEARSRLVIGSDGNAQIDYWLTFRELEAGRSRITTLGKLTPSHRIISSSLCLGGPEGQPVEATLTPKGGGDYSVSFATRTQRGEVYTLKVRYQTTEPLMDRTSRSGQELVVVTWAPPGWNIPVDLQQIDIITPWELPAEITQPEQITPEGTMWTITPPRTSNRAKTGSRSSLSSATPR